jgi:adenylyl-sulfate kinase
MPDGSRPAWRELELRLMPGSREGACIWLTGLPGSGKSTTARALKQTLVERGCRVVVLDGDEIRSGVSRDLGFSRSDRRVNVLRVAALAKQAVEEGNIVICALVSPYRDARAEARTLIGSASFLEVFVDAPLRVCEARDTKGLYAKARSGVLTNVTGISDPYEPPLSADLVLDTANSAVEDSVRILLKVIPGLSAFR